MSLISEPFALFVLVLLAAYFLVPKRWQWVCLLGFSCWFYLAAGVRAAGYILVTALSAYGAALWMEQIHSHRKAQLKAHKLDWSKEEKAAWKNAMTRRCRWVLSGVLGLNLGILCVFKYADFGLELVGAPVRLGLAAPLGISFYTFQTIGYLVEVYWEKVEAQKNFGKLLLFVSFFPQVSQGPISQYDQLAPQLFAEHRFSYRNFSFGAQRMLWGFFKKMVLADRAAPLVQAAFQGYAQMHGNHVLLGALLYSLQIYADFSGYMDIVCGLCQILGITLTENFDRPYFSRSVADYWRRWHISLGTWFKTYVYYPVAISGAAKKLAAWGSGRFGRKFGQTLGASVALVVTWLATGLWHGASWGYVAWGGMNGFLLILALWMEPVYEKAKAVCRIREEAPWWKAFAVLRTFFLVTFIKVFPEVGSFSDGVGFWRQCFTNWELSWGLELLQPIASQKDAWVLGLGVLSMLLVSLGKRRGSVRQQMVSWPAAVKYVLFLGLFFAVILLGVPAQNGEGGFLYAQF